MPSPLLELHGITKRFAGIVALEDVGLTLHAGEVLAVSGENGAGKSTLMKILSGAHRPDAGEMRFEGRPVALQGPADAQALGISIIYQEFSLVPWLDATDNIFLGRELTDRFGRRDRPRMIAEAKAVLDRLGTHLPLSVPVAQLSVAEQQFVEIAKALLRQTRVLIMDEPTATLTPQETERLFRVIRDLKAHGVAILFISHHLEEIYEIADSVLCLRDGRVVGHRPVAGCSTAELIRMMVGREVAATYPARTTATSAKVVLDVRRLQRKPHLPEVSFQLHEGEILGIAGLVGSGRTKMVRALIGADRAHQRDIAVDGRPVTIHSPADAQALGIGLAPEDRKQQGLILDASVRENVLLSGLRKVSHPVWRWLKPAAGDAAVRQQMSGMRVKARSPDQVVRTLSGGNQQKVVLGKLLHAGSRVLIFDEPTRGIDVGAKAEIYHLMRDLTAQGFAIIMISSELPEVLGMSDRILVMRGQRIARVFERGEAVSAENLISHATGAPRD